MRRFTECKLRRSARRGTHCHQGDQQRVAWADEKISQQSRAYVYMLHRDVLLPHSLQGGSALWNVSTTRQAALIYSGRYR